MTKNFREEIERLISDGTLLLRSQIGYYSDFLEWERKVADWLTSAFPGQGLSGEWLSIGPVLLDYNEYGDLKDSAVHHSIREKSGWLGKLAISLDIHENRKQAIPIGGSTKVFLVHGHDESLRESVARFLEKLGLQPLVLHEQPNRGRTVIEKFFDYSNVSFAVVSY